MKINKIKIEKRRIQPGSGATHIESQHLGGRDRQISEFEASLVYKVSSRTARDTQRNPISKKLFKKCFFRSLERWLSG